MRGSVIVMLALCALLVSPALAGEGQGTAEPDSKVEDLDLGTYWYGTEISKEDLKGKVVLVEIWGS